MAKRAKPKGDDLNDLRNDLDIPVAPTTNITKRMQRDFSALRNPNYGNFALYSCFLDGKPTAAIVSIHESPDGGRLFRPLFVAVRQDMKLTNHDGKVAKVRSREERARSVREQKRGRG